jgi:hypothetical protein
MTTKTLAGVMAGCNILVFAAAGFVTPLTGFFSGATWEDTNPRVYPHLAMALGIAAVCVWDLFGSERERLIKSIAGWVQPLTAFTFIVPLLRWPAGSDGPPMFWLLMVWPVTATAMVVASIGLGLVTVTDRRRTGSGAGGGFTDRVRLLFSGAVAAGFAMWSAMPWLGFRWWWR